jgi:hypothetical protein
MSDDKLMASLKQAILRIKPPKGNTTNYSPVRQSLKKYKGSLVIFNEDSKEFEYY